MEDNRKVFYILFAVTELVGLACLGSILFWIFKYNGGLVRPIRAWYNGHILIGAIYVYLYTHAILLFRLRYKIKKSAAKIIHIIMHTLVIPIIIAGITLMALNNRALKKSNFYTLHAWIGLSAVFLSVIQIISTFVVLYCPKIPRRLLGCYMYWHSYFGIFCWILTVGTSLNGCLILAVTKLKSKYKDLGSEAILMNSIGILFVLFGSLAFYLLTEPKYKRTSKMDTNDPIETQAIEMQRN